MEQIQKANMYQKRIHIRMDKRNQAKVSISAYRYKTCSCIHSGRYPTWLYLVRIQRFRTWFQLTRTRFNPYPFPVPNSTMKGMYLTMRNTEPYESGYAFFLDIILSYGREEGLRIAYSYLDTWQQIRRKRTGRIQILSRVVPGNTGKPFPNLFRTCYQIRTHYSQYPHLIRTQL